MDRTEMAEAGIFPAKEPSNGRGRGGKRAGAGRPQLTLAQGREALRRDLANVPATDRRDIVKNLVRDAKAGQPWAVKEFLDRMLGKPVQSLEHRGEPGTLPVVVFIPEGVEEPIDGEVVPSEPASNGKSLPPGESPFDPLT